MNERVQNADIIQNGNVTNKDIKQVEIERNTTKPTFYMNKKIEESTNNQVLSDKKGKVAWSVNETPNLPSFPIDRSSIEIQCLSHVVAARICESLRIRSVDAVYDGASAMCLTSSFLKYEIFLYARPGEDDSTTLEMIRHNGCGLEFRRERELVQLAARGYIEEENSSNIKPDIVMKIPDDMLLSYKGPTEEELKNMIVRSTERLQQTKSLDEKLFVLQQLCADTNSEKVNIETALLMSRLVLANTSNICTAIVDNLNAFSDQCDDIVNYQILGACLGIIANSMEVLTDTKSVPKDVLNTPISLRNDITGAILKVVDKSQCLHNKAAALTCLRLMLTNSHAVGHDITIDKKTRDIIEKARLNGQKYHLNLEQAAESALKVL